jgi:manganese efflux pump family protein
MLLGIDSATYIEFFLIAVSLAMDAFAVSIGKGLTTRGNTLKTALICGLWFGGFQFLMPVIGWLAGSAAVGFIKAFGRVIGCILLALIGCNMIREAYFSGDDDDEPNNKLDAGTMFAAALATSIDALFVGVTYAALDINIFIPAIIIGIVTFAIAFAGSFLGNKIGTRFDKPASLFGGIILILIGLKILLF